LASDLPTTILYDFFQITLRVARPSHPCHLDLITLLIFAEEQPRHYENSLRNLDACKYFPVEALVLRFLLHTILTVRSLSYIYIFMAREPLVGQGPLTVEVLRSYSDTPHSVGLLWTSDQPDRETST
jgi:hypothetical protein